MQLYFSYLFSTFNPSYLCVSSSWASEVALAVKNPPVRAGDAGPIPVSGRSPGGGHGNSLQYSCLENPWIEEPGGLQSMGSQRVRHDWVDLARMHRHIYVPLGCKNRHNVPFARLQCQHMIQADAIITISILPVTNINIYRTKELKTSRTREPVASIKIWTTNLRKIWEVGPGDTTREQMKSPKQ